MRHSAYITESMTILADFSERIWKGKNEKNTDVMNEMVKKNTNKIII